MSEYDDDWVAVPDDDGARVATLVAELECMTAWRDAVFEDTNTTLRAQLDKANSKARCYKRERDRLQYEHDQTHAVRSDRRSLSTLQIEYIHLSAELEETLAQANHYRSKCASLQTQLNDRSKMYMDNPSAWISISLLSRANAANKIQIAFHRLRARRLELAADGEARMHKQSIANFQATIALQYNLIRKATDELERVRERMQ